MNQEKPRFVFTFGYWTDTQTGKRQPAHTYNRALFGFGPGGGAYHTYDCPGCAWFVEHAGKIAAERKALPPVRVAGAM